MNSSSVNSSVVRENQLQFLRFLMFLFVFLHHSRGWIYFSFPDWNGAVSAVSFFFMLSGALCGYYASKKNYELSVKAIATDVFNKAKKQYALYFLTTIFMVFTTELPELVINFRYPDVMTPLQQLARNLLLIQSWFPEGYFSYNGVGWYMSTLMFLYILNIPLSVLLKKFDNQPNRGIICIAGMVLCTALTAVYSYKTNTDNVHFLQYIFPPARLGQYICSAFVGYYISFIKQKISDKPATTILLSLAEIGALAFWFISLYLFQESWRVRLLDWFLPNMLLIAVFLIGKGTVSQIFRVKPLVRLGNMAADAYLIHQIVIKLFIQLTGVTPQTNSGRLICIGTCLVFSLMVVAYCNRTKPAAK